MGGEGKRREKGDRIGQERRDEKGRRGGREEGGKEDGKRGGKERTNQHCISYHNHHMHYITHYITMTSLNTYLLVQLVGKGIRHHGLPSTWRSMEQHHHAGTICDGIIQPHALPAALE